LQRDLEFAVGADQGAQLQAGAGDVGAHGVFPLGRWGNRAV
jgi:hypothetical protein